MTNILWSTIWCFLWIFFISGVGWFCVASVDSQNLWCGCCAVFQGFTDCVLTTFVWFLVTWHVCQLDLGLGLISWNLSGTCPGYISPQNQKLKINKSSNLAYFKIIKNNNYIKIVIIIILDCVIIFLMFKHI